MLTVRFTCRSCLRTQDVQLNYSEPEDAEIFARLITGESPLYINRPADDRDAMICRSECCQSLVMFEIMEDPDV